MQFVYERGPGASGWDAWGSLSDGSRRVAVRRLVVFGGVALWLGAFLLRTGAEGVETLWAHALFAFSLVLVASGTRTVGARLLLHYLSLGAALLGAMYLLAIVLLNPVITDVNLRDIIVPSIEQAMYTVPLFVLLWVKRSGRSWSLSATDLMLVGAAIGVGFGVVEEAYLRADPEDYLAWLPVVYIGERLAPTHAIWAALGGATIGLGLLTRGRLGRAWLFIAASGPVVAAVDHIANNYVDQQDATASVLNTATLDGWLVIGLFLATSTACIVGDIAVQAQLSRAQDRTPVQRGRDFQALSAAWDYSVLRRRLAMADFHWRHTTDGAAKAGAGAEASRIDEVLADWNAPVQITGGPPPPGPAAGPVSRRGASGARAGGGGMPLTIAAVFGAWTQCVGAGSDGIVGGLAAARDVGLNCDWLCLLLGGGGAGGWHDPFPELPPLTREERQWVWDSFPDDKLQRRIWEQYFREERRHEWAMEGTEWYGPWGKPSSDVDVVR